MPIETTAVALAIAVAIIMAGIYGLKRAQPSIAIRVGLGLLLLGLGAALAYSLVFGIEDPLVHPICLGLSAGLAGLGINQIASPLRVAMGKPV